jgi:cysteine-rich repeat protein
VHTGVEECDDGNGVNTDACVMCQNARCGDGYVWAGIEACDDGNTVETDACNNTCSACSCGDGIANCGGEQCDDGNAIDTDACKNNCLNAICGDGVVYAGHEECDDSNTIDTDACRNNCQNAICGDGVVNAGVEACDDGNTVDADFCDNACARRCAAADHDAEATSIYQDHCYVLEASALGWAEAEAGCQAMNARLVSTTSAGEDDFVASLADGSGVGTVWIGLGDSAAEGTYVWTDGSPYSYSNWATGEPSDAFNPPGDPDPNDCVWLQSTPGPDYGQWYDDPCDGLYAYVCEHAWP